MTRVENYSYRSLQKATLGCDLIVGGPLAYDQEGRINLCLGATRNMAAKAVHSTTSLVKPLDRGPESPSLTSGSQLEKPRTLSEAYRGSLFFRLAHFHLRYVLWPINLPHNQQAILLYFCIIAHLIHAHDHEYWRMLSRSLYSA